LESSQREYIPITYLSDEREVQVNYTQKYLRHFIATEGDRKSGLKRGLGSIVEVKAIPVATGKGRQ
jgi:hypothetical protein